MKIIDKRNNKDLNDDFKPGDVVEYWDDEHKEYRGIAILFEHDGELKYLNLKSAVTGSFGGTGNFEALINFTFDHGARYRKVNAKLILED